MIFYTFIFPFFYLLASAFPHVRHRVAWPKAEFPSFVRPTLALRGGFIGATYAHACQRHAESVLQAGLLKEACHLRVALSGSRHRWL
jgi:hypothetical protein